MDFLTFSLPARFPDEWQPSTGTMPFYKLAEHVVRALERQKKTIALAESCTGGMLAKTITDIPGSSNVFECGVVSYSIAVKTRVLGVREETIARFSVVSPEVAAEMAAGVRKLGLADIGIGITGVAGPGPDGVHPEGEIYIALADEAGVRVGSLGPQSAGGRDENRTLAAGQALLMAARYLDK